MKKLLIILILLTPVILQSQVKAFSSAYGGGALTTGGRGGTVLHVTNLDWNDSVGSLKWALEENYPRIIVFDVSGVITIPYSSTYYTLANGDVTIAGQTAPEGGITIRGETITFNGEDNIIIRYIKFRKPGSSSYFDWCLNLTNTSNAIVSNCSFSYSEEFALGAGQSAGVDDGNITFQNNLFTECKDAVLVGNSDGNQTPTGNFSIINNVYSNVGWRSPAKIGGNLKVDIINNAIHNWWTKPIRMDRGGDTNLNLIGNYFQAGSSTENQMSSWENHVLFRVETYEQVVNDKNAVAHWGSPQIWDVDNYYSTRSTGFNPQPTGYPGNRTSAELRLAWEDRLESQYPDPVEHPEPQDAWFQTSTPTLISTAPPTVLSGSAVKTALLATGVVGASKYLNADGTVGTYIDPIDTTAISNFENEVSYSYATNWATAASGLPTMPANTRPAGYDTDNDGMPNTWEIANGLNENVNDSADNDLDANYTNIEMFINLVDGAYTPPTAPQNVTQGATTTTSITVSWGAVQDATSYDIEINDVFVSNVTGGTTYNATGLTENTAYDFNIIAKNVSNTVLGNTERTYSTSSSTPTPPSNNYGKGKSNKSVRKLLMH